MPAGDGTGPMGLGPMTGRAAGYCAGYGVPGYMNPIPGRGAWGWGRARGRGWGTWGTVPLADIAPPLYGTPAPEAERQFLTQQVQALEQQLDWARKRLDDLAPKESEKDT